MICEILALDTYTAEAGITSERYTKGHDGLYAFPDVYASSGVESGSVQNRAVRSFPNRLV